MKKFASRLMPIAILIATSGALAPVYHAQVNSVTRVITVPDGLRFEVDGQTYERGMAAAWPVGTQHVLYVRQGTQDSTNAKYTFAGWESDAQSFDSAMITITTSTDVTEYRAKFAVSYGVTAEIGACDVDVPCYNPGVVLMQGVTVTDRETMYFPAGSTVELRAVPSEGYVFAGWQPAAGQKINGAVNQVTVSAPAKAIARFLPQRSIQFLSSPEEMQLIVDRAYALPPQSFNWGYGTYHTVDVVSPQADRTGRRWVFQSWSDGGAQQHTVRVGASGFSPSLTASFVPAAGITVNTSPAVLPLSIDGATTPPPYNYWWRTGDVHRVEAPAKQKDSQGRTWIFTGWSNGVTETAQDFTVPEENIWLTAQYQLLGTLTINSTLPGAVKVDGADCQTPCTIERPVGTKVNVTASSSIPVNDSVRGDFSGWTGSAPASATEWSATLDGDAMAIWANYRIMNRLLAISEPADSVTWTFQPSSADGFYASQTTVAVIAQAKPGHRFLRWDGDLSGATASGVVVMDAPKTVRAILDADPYVAPTGVVNAAGVTPDEAVAAGSIASIFGANLAAETAVGPNSPLAQTLGGVTVRLKDRLLPLFFVSPGQINLQVPPDLAPGDYTLTVSPQSMKEVSVDFKVQRNAPGIFQYAVEDALFALVLHEDSTLVETSKPAKRGELLTVYATGFGPLNHARLAGLAIPDEPVFLAADQVEVFAGDTPLIVEQAFAAAGRVGVDCVRFRLPGSIPSGAAPLKIRIREKNSNTATLPVE